MKLRESIILVVFCAVTTSALPSIRNYTDDSLERKPSPDDLYRLNNLSPNDNAEEFSGQIEGDMLIEEDEWKGYTGRLEPNLRWPGNVVHYWINETFFDSAQIREIHRAARYLHDRTCLHFGWHQTWPGNTRDHIYVTGDSVGCAALVGRRGGPQRLRLQPSAPGTGCFRFGTLIHEFIHAIGFHHMHNTYDRDRSIRINWQNVRPDRVDRFDTRPNTQISNFNVPYDVGSVMHYSETTSSVNGLPTMTALFNPHNRQMGQRIEATAEDLLRINRMYGCPNFPRLN